MLFDPSQIRGVKESRLETASRTLTLADDLMHLYSNSGSNITLTVPVAVFTLDDEIEFACDSTGTITLACGEGFTINGASNSVVCATGKGGYLKFRSSSSARWFGG